MLIPLTPTQIDGLIKRADQTSVVASNSVRVISPKGNDIVTATLNLSAPKIHDPAKGDKNEGVDELETVEVFTECTYKWFSFPDKNYENAEAQHRAVIAASVPVVAESADSYAFGTLENQKYKPIKNIAYEADTEAGLQAVNDQLNEDEFTGDVWLLKFKLRPLIRKIVAASGVSAAKTSVNDGEAFFDGRVFFRKRLTTPTTDIVGIVYDSDQLVYVTQANITINIFDPNESPTARAKNSYLAYVGVWQGMTLANQDAAYLLSSAAAPAGGGN